MIKLEVELTLLGNVNLYVFCLFSNIKRYIYTLEFVIIGRADWIIMLYVLILLLLLLQF